VIGAVYVERGLAEAGTLIHRLFDPVIERSARLGAGLDWKTSLQELTASGVLGVPEYHVDESGPDHQKSFRALVRVGGRVYGTGEGHSKKEAEQQAAEAAWTAISNGEAPVDGGADAPAWQRPGRTRASGPAAGDGVASARAAGDQAGGDGAAGDRAAGPGAGSGDGATGASLRSLAGEGPALPRHGLGASRPDADGQRAGATPAG